MEVRDLTREEMLEINKRNEEVMNRELGAMTVGLGGERWTQSQGICWEMSVDEGREVKIVFYFADSSLTDRGG
eukprot:scaffold1976_cov187-Alexandrium_tamarense.AAC.17